MILQTMFTTILLALSPFISDSVSINKKGKRQKYSPVNSRQ